MPESIASESQQEQAQEQQPSFTPITSQEDLNKVIAERIQRERGKYADYKDLQAKAARLDEIEEASKTEAQKQAEALAKAQAELNEFKTRAQIQEWTAQVAAEAGVPAGILRGSSLEELQKHAADIKAALPEAPVAKRRAPVIPSEGQSDRTGGSAADLFAAAIEGHL